MPRRWSRLALLLVACALVVAAAPMPPAVVRAQDEDARFAELLAARTSTVAFTAPATATFVQVAGSAATASLHLSVTDFSVSAIFTNPTETTAPWDYGFSFRETGETGQDVFVDSDGTWYYGTIPQGIQQSGTVPEFDPAPGAMNRLDLIVDGTTALFGVNGEFVTSLALPPPGGAADVRASTGYFDDTVVAGREIRFDNFIVWPLPEPEPPAPDLSPTDIAAFGEAVSGQPAPPSLVGPLSGTLEESEETFGSLSAGVVPLPFHAQATFQVPQESLIPWDIGFAFGLTPDGSLRVIADANGLCWFAAGPEAVSTQVCAANGLRTTAGEANTLELIATAERAFLVINGRLTAAFDLPPDVEATDPKAAVGMLAGQVVPGRVTEVSDFTVWPLPSQPAEPATPAVTPATPVAAEEVAAHFAALLAARETTTRLAGPFAEPIPQVAQSLESIAAGITTADFMASVTFVNPSDATDSRWDYGFVFHETADTKQGVLVDSDGIWTHVTWPERIEQSGALPARFDLAPGATNSLEIVVAGATALFGVNGEYVATLALPSPIAADVEVGTGYFNSDIVAGREIDFRDFSVWPLPAQLEDLTTPAATLAATPAAADREQFLALLVGTEDGVPIAGPFSGRLVEQTPGTPPTAPAGVALADFAAFATFTNPEPVADVFWDAGFSFRRTAETGNLLILDSAGDLYSALAGQDAALLGHADAYDPAPGAANTLQLFVAGDRALVGVNGQFVAAFAVPGEDISSDVLIGAARFDQDFAAGRATAYQDFRVWPLEEGDLEATDLDGS